MEVKDILLWALASLKPMLPGFAVAVVATVAMIAYLLAGSKKLWVEDKKFPLVGLFFGLDKKGFLRISCSWLKLVFYLFFIISFRKLDFLNYMMLFIPGLFLAVTDYGIKKVAGSLFWLIMQLAGLLSANLICGFIADMNAGIEFLVVYITMAIFLILFALYLFLNEIASTSLGRSVDPVRVWGAGKENN